MDPKRVKRQMRFYKWLVVEANPASMLYQVIPMESREEAEALADDIGRRRVGPGAQVFVAEARLDDDGNLFWSGTDMGEPIPD